MRGRDFLLEDLPGGLPVSGADFADVVVVELVGESFSEEVGEGIEVVAVEELTFDGGVEGFDFGVGVVAAWGDIAVVGAHELFDGEDETTVGFADGSAIEFGAVVSMNGHGSEVDATAAQVSEHDGDSDGGVGDGIVSGEEAEHGAGADLAEGVEVAGQVHGHELRPIAGDIGEVFGIHLDLGKGGKGGFDGS